MFFTKYTTMSVYKESNTRGVLKEANKAWMWQHTMNAFTGLRKRLSDMQAGKLTKFSYKLPNPQNPKSPLHITYQYADGHLYTTYWMDDSRVWRWCEALREEDAEMRRSHAQNAELPIREYYKSTWLLEAYILLKYGIDVYAEAWNDPTSAEFKKFAWIMDHDEFASRYKVTHLQETRGMPNPFEKIQINMGDTAAILKDDKLIIDTGLQ